MVKKEMTLVLNILAGAKSMRGALNVMVCKHFFVYFCFHPMNGKCSLMARLPSSVGML